MMTAVWERARAEIRRRWGAYVALALLLGLGGGLVIATTTGGRRAATVYDRFLSESRAADVEVIDDNSDIATPIPQSISTLPQVASVARYFYSYVQLGEGVAFVIPIDDAYGSSIDRIRVVQGHLPKAIGEAVISIGAAQRFKLRIGSEIPFVTPDFIDFLKARGVPAGVLRRVADLHIHVVGIEAAPAELPPADIGGVGVHMSKQLLELISSFEPIRPSYAIRLKQPGDIAAFRRSLSSLTPGKVIFSGTPREFGSGARRSFRLQATAFWLLSALLALVSILIFGQSLARQAALESVETPTLHALGMSRAQLFAVGMMRATVTAVPAAVIGAVLGFLLTPLSPIGLARKVEPQPGLYLDRSVEAIGIAALVSIAIILASVPAWRSSRVRSGEARSDLRTSWLGSALARSGSPPTTVAAARLAFQTGRGRTAVPVRSSLAGTTIGVAAFVAALCFGTSLVHLIRTPQLYGWRWDFVGTSYGENNYAPYTKAAAAVPGVKDFVAGQFAVPLRVETLEVSAMAVSDRHGDALPPIVEGRDVRGPGEIVLGGKALREIHKRVGDVISVRLSTHVAYAGGPGGGGSTVHMMRIVGRGVFPPIVDDLGRGALISFDSFPEIPQELRVVEEIALRFQPGADRHVVLDGIQKALLPASRNGPQAGSLVFQELPRTTPDDVLNFGQVRNLPLILAGLLAAIAAATLAHVLVSSIHRRARDLALLKTLGFLRSQVRAVVAWQAAFLALATLLIGVPTGLAIGRWTWNVFADRVGVVPSPRIPILAVCLVIPATVVLANLLGVVPARSAARTQPAMVLRTE